MKLSLTQRQYDFITATADEVLFGGAAGGGKSYGQLADALIYALKYPKSKQIIFRRTFPELEKSIIRTSLALYPREVSTYNDSKHTYTFANGSIIDFGYCDAENDVYKYQSAEYDVIRFDELTHFTETMYLYLMSRCRGANPYPKQIKSSTNPGGVGHTWVKERFIDPCAPDSVQKVRLGKKTMTRIFLPSKVQDNKFLMDADPEYVARLENLPQKERKALLYGDWDIFEGQFYPEFDRNIHVCDPFPIPSHWRIYTTMDYGMDMLAHYVIAVDECENAYVISEIYRSGLIVSGAVKAIGEVTEGDGDGFDGYNVYARLAPPDLFNRQSIDGKSTSDLFAENGMILTKTSNDVIAGTLAVRELLRKTVDVEGKPSARLHIFRNCKNLIRVLPQLQYDPKDPNKPAKEPHEITHANDALRYFAVYWVNPAEKPRKKRVKWQDWQWEDYRNARNEAEKAEIIKEYGNPF